MATGRVKMYNTTKGFGFIVADTGEGDIFVHSSGLKAIIKENDKVQYDVENGKKGATAINVSLVG
ncbi:MAG: cold shock domain-containing protein [Bacteroidota bacterium]